MGKVTVTFTANPSSYDSDYAAYSTSNISRGYASETSSTTAVIGCTRGSVGAVTYFYYKFNTSTIPQDVTIDSVTIVAKARSSTGSNNYLAKRQVQAFSGTTAKGTAKTITTNTNAFTLDSGTWTRNEIDDVRIRLYAERGTTNLNSGYNLTFYGATLTIVYSYNDGQGPDIYYKQNGSWVQAEAVFYKSNGSWVEVEGMAVKDNGTWKT